MKHPFNRFAVRYLAAVLLGLLALMLHGSVQGGILAVLVPQAPSPWELSKLAFWPLLAVALLSGVKREHGLGRQLPMLVIAPVAMTLVCWALLSLGGSGRCAWWCGCACWRRFLPWECRRSWAAGLCGRCWCWLWRGFTSC